MLKKKIPLPVQETQETQVRSLGWDDPNLDSWRRKWQSTPVFLPGRFHGQGTLMGFSPWGRRESGQLSTQCLGFPGGSVVNPPASAGVRVQPLGREDPLEEEMATHSSIPAWRIHSQRSPGSYLPMGSRESDTTWQLNHHHHI